MIQPVPPTPAAPEPIVKPDPGSKLGQLLALFDQLKAAADHASEQLEACKAAIKVEATSAAPGARAIVVDSPDLAEPLRVHYSPRKRLDTKRFQAEQPTAFAVYQAYQVPGAASWTIKAVRR